MKSAFIALASAALIILAIVIPLLPITPEWFRIVLFSTVLCSGVLCFIIWLHGVTFSEQMTYTAIITPPTISNKGSNK